MLQDVDNLIESEDQVKAGVLVLINDADWELFGCADYIIGKKDRITFISTLHGGWPLLKLLFSHSVNTVIHCPKFFLNKKEKFLDDEYS